MLGAVHDALFQIVFNGAIFGAVSFAMRYNRHIAPIVRTWRRERECSGSFVSDRITHLFARVVVLHVLCVLDHIE